MVLAAGGASCTQACDARCTPCDELATVELTATAATCSNASSDACGAITAAAHAPSLFLEGGCVAFGATVHTLGNSNPSPSPNPSPNPSPLTLSPTPTLTVSLTLTPTPTLTPNPNPNQVLRLVDPYQAVRQAWATHRLQKGAC